MDIKDILSKAIEDAAKKAMAEGVFAEAELPKIILEVPPQKEFGDFATNFAMEGDLPCCEFFAGGTAITGFFSSDINFDLCFCYFLGFFAGFYTALAKFHEIGRASCRERV